MRRVLVTGASGFIGRACLPLLVQSGHEVHAVSTRERPTTVVDARWHRADLLDPSQISVLLDSIRADTLLHLAWHAVPGDWRESVENLRWVEASLGLMRAFAESGGSRAVVAGSCAEYDLRYGFCSEELTPLHPATLYGSCKHAVQSAMDGGARALGVSLAWARIFHVYGPGEHPQRLVASVIRSLLAGESPQCTTGHQIRDYLHSHDVASALLHLVEGDIEGPINVGSGIPISVADLVTRISTATGGDVPVEFGRLPSPSGDAPFVVADVSRLRSSGWRPSLALDDGLTQTIRWWADTMSPKSPPH